MASLILDSDVMLNWLLQETETGTGRPLWVAPATIMELGERRQVWTQWSLLSLMEVRFVLRRKKKFGVKEIETDLRSLQSIIDTLVPTENELAQAERLQSEIPLGPFDSIILAQAIARGSILVSRDAALLALAKGYVHASTPEQYIDSLL